MWGFWKTFKELCGFTTNETHAGVDIPFSKSLVFIFFPLWYLMGISWTSSGYHTGITRGSKNPSVIFTLNFTLNKRLWPWAIPKSRACSPHIGPYSGDTHGLELYPTFWEPSTRAPYTHSSSSGFLNHRHFYFTFRRSHLIGPAPIFLGTWAALTQHRSPNMLPSPPK